MKPIKPSNKPPKKKLSKKEKRKKRLRIFYGVTFCLGVIIYYGTRPYEASPPFGVCRTFVELQLRFPQTLFISSLEQFERSWRMYYTFTGSSGEQRASMIDCRFSTNQNTGYPYLEDIQIDRVKIDKKKVAAFNKIIPIIMSANPKFLDPGVLEDKELVELKAEWQYHDWETSRD